MVLRADTRGATRRVPDRAVVVPGVSRDGAYTGNVCGLPVGVVRLSVVSVVPFLRIELRRAVVAQIEGPL
jgi:hypothetical protein